ncbi:MAG: trehalose-phosphatase [Pseudomonadota bacterium]|nr:trehalose-phosphatase [Pseudomonadota bacterium]
MEQPSRLAAAPPAIDPARTSLFLDFDGTLVDLVDRPQAVTVNADLSTLLARLALRLEGRLAVVSGRSIAQLADFFGPSSGTVALVGSHGAEVQTLGSTVVAPQAPAALGKAEHLFAQAFIGNEGIFIEVKTLGVAIHYRLDPSAEAAAVSLAHDFASNHGLKLQRGKMMVEVRSAGHDKGSGIAALMNMPPFAGSVPIFLGDDLTDEPGFRRCSEIGGAGVLVGEPRPTAAQYWLPDVAAVHAWLAAQ